MAPSNCSARQHRSVWHEASATVHGFTQQRVLSGSLYVLISVHGPYRPLKQLHHLHRWAEGVPTAADCGPFQKPDSVPASPHLVLTTAGVNASLLFLTHIHCAWLTDPMCVQDLSVNENRVESIEGVFSNHLCLQRLKVATNRLSALTALPWLPQLRSLDVSDNPLSTISALSLQPALTTLNLSFCSLSQESIMTAISPLGQLADLQAHDNTALQMQNDSADPSSQNVQSATLRTLPWLRDLDHMETRCCDVVSAAVKALYLNPRLLLSWRRQVVSGNKSAHPISTKMLEGMNSRTETVRHLDGEDDGCSVGEILAALGLHRGGQTPLNGSNAYGNSSFGEHHAAAQLHANLQEQYRLLTAHGGACTQLLRTLTAGGDVDQSLCICLLYTSPSPRDRTRSRMPSSA